METVLALAFFVIAAALWTSAFGYVLALRVLARKRRDAPPRGADPPIVAVVIPVWNEEGLIRWKINDLRRSDYPAGQMKIIFVDGGSTDHTSEIVEQEAARDARIRLLRFGNIRGQAHQLNAALAEVTEDFVVVTDADAALNPGCIRTLIGELVGDPVTVVVGAMLRPDTPLIEEHIHWWMLNTLWWLEGEALSSAMVSGACWAARRRELLPVRLHPDARVMDVCVAASAAARGLGVRLCSGAQAADTRAPRNVREFVSYRRRRGNLFLGELFRAGDPLRHDARWRLAGAMRWWSFRVLPVLAAAVSGFAAVLLFTSWWLWVLVAALAFLVPAFGSLLASRTLARECPSRLKVALAGVRLVGLTLFSLFGVHRRPADASGQRERFERVAG